MWVSKGQGITTVPKDIDFILEWKTILEEEGIDIVTEDGGIREEVAFKDFRLDVFPSCLGHAFFGSPETELEERLVVPGGTFLRVLLHSCFSSLWWEGSGGGGVQFLLPLPF